MISVIIPNYNHSQFLKQRIDSVLNQTYQNFEIIILDDCSTDNSKEIIEKYRDNPKIQEIIYNETNSGSTFKQWQKGIQLAKAQYIWIAESDDFSDASFLQTVIQPFFKYPDLILSYCQSMIVDEKGSCQGMSVWADEIDNFKWKKNYIEETSVEISRYLNFRNTIVNASAVVFKKPTDINILEESSKMKMLGDWLFWRKLLAMNGKIAFFSNPLNFFRLHQQTTRVAATKEKELTRMKEYYRLIVPASLSIYDNRYDWMIREWYDNRRVLKNTKYYYKPDLPAILIVRYFLFAIRKIKEKSFKLFSSKG